MSEAITVPTSTTTATTTNGKKAFKYIASVTPNVTNAITYSVGTTDIFGLPLLSNFFSDLAINYNATGITATTAPGTSPLAQAAGAGLGAYMAFRK